MYLRIGPRGCVCSKVGFMPAAEMRTEPRGCLYSKDGLMSAAEMWIRPARMRADYMALV